MGKQTNNTVSYIYSFNYDGADTFNDEVINGANINIRLSAYIGNKEAKLSEELVTKDGYCLSDIVIVSFDREKQFVVKVNNEIYNSFARELGWTSFFVEEMGYGLCYESEWTEEELKTMPKGFGELPISKVMDVSEEEFRGFIADHLDDFDIPDNAKAQLL